MKKVFSAALAILLALACSPTVFADENKTYTFSIVPQQSAKRLAQIWAPILKHLSEESGLKLRFVTAKDIPTFEKRLANGDYDFAYMNPYHFTVFNQNPGYRAVAKRKDQPIRGIVVVRKDSDATTLSDLDGVRMAYPSPAAFAASVLPRAKLISDGLNIEPHYVSSHDSVYLGVAKGIFAAGGGVKRTLNNIPADVRDQLKVLWTSAPYTPHAIASHPDIDDKTYQKLQAALVKMYHSEQGKTLLKSLKVKHGFQAASDHDWDDVRGLGIELLATLISE